MGIRTTWEYFSSWDERRIRLLKGKVRTGTSDRNKNSKNHRAFAPPTFEDVVGKCSRLSAGHSSLIDLRLDQTVSTSPSDCSECTAKDGG